jgi:hypothetical protein
MVTITLSFVVVSGGKVILRITLLLFSTEQPGADCYPEIDNVFQAILS